MYSRCPQLAEPISRQLTTDHLWSVAAFGPLIVPSCRAVKTRTTITIVRQMERQQRTWYISCILLIGCVLRVRLIQAQLRWTCPERNLPQILT